MTRRASTSTRETVLRAWLRQTHHTQTWFAKKINASQGFVSMIVQGKRDPSLRLSKRITQLTGIPAEQLGRLTRPRARRGPPGTREQRPLPAEFQAFRTPLRRPRLRPPDEDDDDDRTTDLDTNFDPDTDADADADES